MCLLYTVVFWMLVKLFFLVLSHTGTSIYNMLPLYIIEKTEGKGNQWKLEKMLRNWRICIEIFPYAHPQPHRASLFVFVRHIHALTLLYRL